MFVVTVTFVAKESHRDRFLEIMLLTAARSVADEPGCRQFDVCCDRRDPGRVFLYEVYDDEAAFEAHRASPHSQAFFRDTEGLIESREVQMWIRQPPEAAS